MELLSCDRPPRRSPVRTGPAFRKAKRDYQQPDLIPPTFEDLVGADDPCRLVVMLVSLLDLTDLRNQLKLVGAPYYPLEVMLALEMFSRWDGEFGSRRVEKRCKFDVRYQFICRGLTPDHTTIWRFRRFLGSSVDKLLAQSVRLGKKLGLVSKGRMSLDGTKLPAAASQWAKYRHACEEADSDLSGKQEWQEIDEASIQGAAAVEESVPLGDEARSLEEADSDPSGKPERREIDEASIQGAAAVEEPVPLGDEARSLEEAARMIEEFKKPVARDEVLAGKDPDARTMKTTKGHYITGYNGQFLTDEDTHLVTAFHVSNNAADAQLLEPTLNHYQALHAELPKSVVADSGYDTPYNAQVISDLKIDGCIASAERKAFWRLDDQDRPICPMNHVAVLTGVARKGDVSTLRYVVKECPDCPLRSRCLAKPKHPDEEPMPTRRKMLTCDSRAHVHLWIRQRAKAKTPEGKERLKERGQTSELGFARLKGLMQFRRLSMWGLSGAKTEVGLMALALNLDILARRFGLRELEEFLNDLFGLIMQFVCILWAWPDATRGLTATSCRLSRRSQTIAYVSLTPP